MLKNRCIPCLTFPQSHVLFPFCSASESIFHLYRALTVHRLHFEPFVTSARALVALEDAVQNGDSLKWTSWDGSCLMAN